MTPPIPDDTEIMKEIFRLRPPTTRAQAEARNRAGQALEEKYPNRHVAYVDNWNGDELDRVVVAASADWDEFQNLLRALDPEVSKRVEVEFVRDPEEGFFIGGYGII